MCLLSNDICPSIAENDIECYKVIKMAFQQALTPYVNFPIEKDILEGKCFLFANDLKKVIFNEWLSLNEVSGGYIHTFSSLEEARKSVWYSINIDAFLYNGIKFAIFKCIIPKGTEYYMGYCENGTYYSLLYKDRKKIPLNSYASEKIKFVKELTTIET